MSNPGQEPDDEQGNGQDDDGNGGDDKDLNSSSSSTPTEVIVGGIVGGVVAIALIGSLVWFLLRRKREANTGGYEKVTKLKPAYLAAQNLKLSSSPPSSYMSQGDTSELYGAALPRELQAELNSRREPSKAKSHAYNHRLPAVLREPPQRNAMREDKNPAAESDAGFVYIRVTYETLAISSSFVTAMQSSERALFLFSMRATCNVSADCGW